MWRENFINANPATIMQRLYQIKAEQDGEDVTIIAHAKKREDLPARETGAESCQRAAAIKPFGHLAAMGGWR